MAIARGKPYQGVVLAVVFREKGGERARTWFDPGISPCTGPWWLSPRGEGTGEGAPPPGGEGSQGDTRWEAVPGSGADVGFLKDRENPCPGMQTPGRCETRSMVSSGESAGN